MIFADMIAGVTEWTKRPDMEARAASAIRAITLKYHRKHKFFKDLVTLPVTSPDPTTGVISLDIATTFPQWRQFADIGVTGFQGSFDPATIDDLTDLDGYSKQNIYFVAGTTLNIKARAGFDQLSVTYYKDPVVWPADAYSSWIANEQPDLIIAGAAARVFAFDNENEIFKAAKIEEAEQYAVLVSSNLEAVAR